jgi:hypothetical protein
MSHPITGYYSFRQEKLLKNFDQTFALIRDSLVARYGTELANALGKEARCEYENLIPEIPYITRARMLNLFLLITAQELAALRYRTLSTKSATKKLNIRQLAVKLD